MHTKLKILLCRPRWAILLVLVLLIISSFCVTSTDTEPQKEEMLLAKYHPLVIPHPRLSSMIEPPTDLWIIGQRDLAPPGYILEEFNWLFP